MTHPPCTECATPTETDDLGCPACQRQQVARIRPGYLDRLKAAAIDDDTAAGIYDATIAAVHSTALRLTWQHLHDSPLTPLQQLTLISQGHQLLEAVQGHAGFPSDVAAAIAGVFDVAEALGADAGVLTPTPALQLA